MPDLVVISPSPLVKVERPSVTADSPPPFVSFAMPAFNEEDNIERAVSECLSAFVSAGLSTEPPKAGPTGARWGEIVITNDCSRDSTGEILARMQESLPNLVVVTHLEKNQGYGRALSDAIAATRGEWVATIDSDGQFDPADLPRLLALARDDLDLVAGYRMRKKDSLTRIIADRGLNFIVRALFGIRHRDTNCAFKLVRGDVLRGLSIETNGFQTPTEIVLKLHALGHKMVETGVKHRVREEGKSKLKVIKTSLDFLRYLFYLRTKITLYKKRILARL
jgi:glycosyltransferase involved in cell wall biosynthesis